MMEQLIDQEETVRVCHYCHIKVYMNDSANDGKENERLIADKLEILAGNNSDSEDQNNAEVEEMALWLGAGDAQNQAKLKQM